jgi:transposase
MLEGMVDNLEVKAPFEMLAPLLNERTRRLAAAAEAAAIGRSGIARVSRATGVSRRAIAWGLDQLKTPDVLDDDRIRRPGGGRKRTVETDATIRADLERLIDPVTRGDPESPLRWTCKSIRKLAEELRRMGHATSHRMVAELLHESGYSLQSNRKTIEGKGHPDRNAQLERINRKVRAALKAGEPVISVDAKKKELVGDFKNAGREWRPEGDPELVHVYDFAIPVGDQSLEGGHGEDQVEEGQVPRRVELHRPPPAAKLIVRMPRQTTRPARVGLPDRNGRCDSWGPRSWPRRSPETLSC